MQPWSSSSSCAGPFTGTGILRRFPTSHRRAQTPFQLLMLLSHGLSLTLCYHLAFRHGSIPGLGHCFFSVTGPDCRAQTRARPGGSCRLRTTSSCHQDCGYGAFSVVCLISTELAHLSSHGHPPHCVGIAQRRATPGHFPVPKTSTPGRDCSFGAVRSPRMLQYTPTSPPF